MARLAARLEGLDDEHAAAAAKTLSRSRSDTYLPEEETECHPAQLEWCHDQFVASLVYYPGMEVPRPANDNSPNPPPPRWDVYRAASRGRWVGQVIASNAYEAIEAAAFEFNTDIRKLIAVRRFEIG
jgi:hypothetical protein